MQTAIALAERGLLPSGALRLGIRRLVRRRLQEQEGRPRALDAWIEEMGRSPIALSIDAANAQHYEMPPAFFELVLGPHLKYSGAYWADGTRSLADAERAMLDLTMARAELADGQRILELGCGWGSLSLAMACRFPRARIVAVSNSRRQREFIMSRARRDRLDGLTVVTAGTPGKYTVAFA